MRWLIFISLILSVLCGAAALVLQSRKERQLLEQSLALQEQVTNAGLKEAWLEDLGKAVDQGKIPPGYVLKFDRLGRELISEFFPVQQSTMDWARFRSADTQGKLAFLEQALAMPLSWDRVLAIPQYQELTKQLPTNISGYEETLVSEEAKRAYKLILDCVTSDFDYLSLDEMSVFKGCFLKVNEEGQVLAFIPKNADVKRLILPEFGQRMGRHQADTAGTSIQFVPGAVTGADQGPVSSSFVLWGTAISLLLLAGWAFRRVRFMERDELNHRISFLNQLTHELHTPLAAIKLHAQIMQRTGFNPESVDSLVFSADRLSALFQEIKALNSPTSIRVGTPMSGAILQSIVAEVAGFPSASCSLEGHLSGTYWAEANRFRLILRNLTQNAARYGKHVTIRLNEDAASCSILVMDDGPGVSRQDAKHIFKPFYRAMAATKAAPDGLGLGLSLARKAAGEMGATLELTNAGEPGAAFRLKLQSGSKR